MKAKGKGSESEGKKEQKAGVRLSQYRIFVKDNQQYHFTE